MNEKARSFNSGTIIYNEKGISLYGYGIGFAVRLPWPSDVENMSRVHRVMKDYVSSNIEPLSVSDALEFVDECFMWATDNRG